MRIALPMLAWIWSTSSLLPLVVLGSRDQNTYGSFNNPNFAYSHYWDDAPNVLQDLSSFQALYVTYHNCAWSAKYNQQKEEQHRHLPEDDRQKEGKEGQCGQAGGEGDGNWYRGMGECYGSNVAYTLYGVLKTDSAGRNPCTRQTFINSFYTTDGLQSFSDASNGAVDDSSISQTCTSIENGASSTTLGCSSTGQFQVDEFSGYGCLGMYYESTLEPLEELNAALTNSMQCKMIYKSDGSVNYATDLLANSMACTTEGSNKDFCPDPFGMLSAYQYNFVMAQQNSNYTVVVASASRGHPKTRKVFGVFLLLGGVVLLAMTFQNWRKARHAAKSTPSEPLSAQDHFFS